MWIRFEDTLNIALLYKESKRSIDRVVIAPANGVAIKIEPGSDIPCRRQVLMVRAGKLFLFQDISMAMVPAIVATQKEVTIWKYEAESDRKNIGVGGRLAHKQAVASILVVCGGQLVLAPRTSQFFFLPRPGCLFLWLASKCIKMRIGKQGHVRQWPWDCDGHGQAFCAVVIIFGIACRCAIIHLRAIRRT